MKAADIWGACPFRRVGWAKYGGWSYICGKNDEVCDPNYCLGPDEDKKEGDRKIFEVAHEEGVLKIED